MSARAATTTPTVTAFLDLAIARLPSAASSPVISGFGAALHDGRLDRHDGPRRMQPAPGVGSDLSGHTEVMTNLGSPDITDLILAAHGQFREQFVALWDLRPAGDDRALDAVWRPLADLLEVHAKAEEEILYPALLKRGSDDAPAETDDAIGDHNDIRDAIRTAATVALGSDDWWEAVMQCRKANDEHLAEEERDVIPDFREHSDEELRSALGVRWTAFHAEHRGARGVSGDNVAPDEYIEDHS